MIIMLLFIVFIMFVQNHLLILLFSHTFFFNFLRLGIVFFLHICMANTKHRAGHREGNDGLMLDNNEFVKYFQCHMKVFNFPKPHFLISTKRSNTTVFTRTCAVYLQLHMRLLNK